RPYLFSNSLAPVVVAASQQALQLLSEGHGLRQRLWENVRYFRGAMSAAGFTLAGADHAIIPVMLGDARLAQTFASRLQQEGIYVTGFCYPVVPKGQARIRTQISAAHGQPQLERAVAAFSHIGRQLGVIA
ncbi:aminotransferase class I/II-fold pyridoxal phosphate-dependent enzyme, partial [Erwinia sp. B116]